MTLETSVSTVTSIGGLRDGLRSLGCISRDLKNLRDHGGDHPEPAWIFRDLGDLPQRLL